MEKKFIECKVKLFTNHTRNSKSIIIEGRSLEKISLIDLINFRDIFILQDSIGSLQVCQYCKNGYNILYDIEFKMDEIYIEDYIVSILEDDYVDLFLYIKGYLTFYIKGYKEGAVDYINSLKVKREDSTYL